MRGLHQMAGLGLLGDFQHQIPIRNCPPSRGVGIPLDERLARRITQGKRNAKLAQALSQPSGKGP